ncbi:phosphoglycolate phosphatase [Noviherbaspirillum humi]|uniref:Phosphoglycolate phosphatase n=1 Tax=Noviherbaspirillum humi TaxID=1688639 RepID=A0A239LR05_9BURK|nr:phosphoglycolate phosphatase [Noviherbaspirillum humi]SNT32720.1 phosphoglycolate phosphatase [Noviherbaspirillum humi]
MSASLSGIRAAIIDLDGTLLHTAPDFHIAINRMRNELDLAPVGIETIERFVGKGTEHLVRQIIGLDYDQPTVQERLTPALDSYHRHYHAINGDHVTLYPQVKEGLEALRAKGLRLACVTNKPVGFAVPLLEKTGLAFWFELVYGGDSFARKKPDPYPLLQVCKAFGLEPHQVVAIGDSTNDAEAARAAGCRSLTVPYGYNHGQPVQEIDSDGIVSTLLDAAHIISG